jgi:hypothetical protein
MRIILNILPYDITSNRIVSGQEFVISGQLAMEIMPLKVSTAESDKYRRHLQHEESSLGVERMTSIYPKRASSSKT